MLIVYMPKALSITQNALAVLALVAIISVSAITTLGLSPVAIDNTSQHVAGISTTQDP